MVSIVPAGTSSEEAPTCKVDWVELDGVGAAICCGEVVGSAWTMGLLITRRLVMRIERGKEPAVSMGFLKEMLLNFMGAYLLPQSRFDGETPRLVLFRSDGALSG
jgi:hypothetical protein